MRDLAVAVAVEVDDADVALFGLGEDESVQAQFGRVPLNFFGLPFECAQGTSPWQRMVESSSQEWGSAFCSNRATRRATYGRRLWTSDEVDNLTAPRIASLQLDGL